ncbi:MAG: hypothetical protein U0361_24880 [Nitrospiraceae bacterium]
MRHYCKGQLNDFDDGIMMTVEQQPLDPLFAVIDDLSIKNRPDMTRRRA